jgi:hypothetical protein
MRLKSEEKSQQLTASHNNKEREAERALEKRDRVVGLLEDETTKTTVPPRRVVVPAGLRKPVFTRGR